MPAHLNNELLQALRACQLSKEQAATFSSLPSLLATEFNMSTRFVLYKFVLEGREKTGMANLLETVGEQLRGRSRS